jgi:heme-degrading monooxygenase HmoA
VRSAGDLRLPFHEEEVFMPTKSRFFVTAGASAAVALLGLAALATRAHAAAPEDATRIRIARMWHGRVPDAKAAEYFDYLNHDGVDKIEKIPHNLGADVLTSSHDGITEFVVISYWHSLDDIKAYAGADIEKVHNLARDPEFLIEPETKVRHFVVRRSDRQAAGQSAH